MKRSSTAVWHGTLKEGSGTLTTQSKTLNETPYSFLSRFENERGTNPEELIAAAHAGCFTMMLSNLLTEAKHNIIKIETTAEITLDPVSKSIATSHLFVKAEIPNISRAKFAELAKDAEQNCPISKLLKAKIKMEYELN